MNISFHIQFLLGIIIQVYAQISRKLGDECIPGMCSAVNSNCKWNGNLFKCVCKEKFLAVNQTHCGHPMSNIEEQKCRDCLERDSLCLDFDNDGITDECWCPKNESCSKLYASKQNSKSLKNTDISMLLFDAVNNRAILDGNSVFLGDQIVIDIKTTKKDSSVSLAVENCTISALSNSEDIFVEKVELIKKGCPVPNDVSPMSLSFRSISDIHIESNVFEIFKLRSSSTILINCWVQICAKKCPQKACNDQGSTNNPNNRNIPNKNSDNDNSLDGYVFKDTSIKVIIDDPYGVQQSGSNSNQAKNNGVFPNVIELEIRSRPFSGLIRSIIVSVISIIFAIIISITSILVYRACIRDQMLNSSRSDAPESICPTSESCKYEMNTRHLDESYLQNPVEPLAAHTNNPRW